MLTPKEREWRRRLLQLALDASNEDLPCIEQGVMAIMAALTLKYSKQRTVALIFRDLADLLEGNTGKENPQG